MWEYWKEKHGIEDALEYQYAELLKSDPDLLRWLNQIKDAKKLIDNRMKEIEDAN